MRFFLLLFSLVVTVAGQALAAEPMHVNQLRAALLTSEMATDARLKELWGSGYTSIVLVVSKADAASALLDRQAVERITKTGLAPYYWIEIARCPEMADAHPLWMASLQGHPEWRRFHKDF